jgi:hypothetical protein
MEEYYAIAEDASNNNFAHYNFEQTVHDEEYIDHYFWGAMNPDVEFCISEYHTDEDNGAYLGRDLYIIVDDDEQPQLMGVEDIEHFAETGKW